MIVSITGGKGGIGKTLGALSLAKHAAKIGQKTLLVDANFGLSNISILLETKRERCIEEVLSAQVKPSAAITETGYGFDVLPSSYVGHHPGRFQFCHETTAKVIAELRSMYDVVIVNSGTGINDLSQSLHSFSDQIIVMTGLEPHSITDAYAMIKLLHKKPDVDSRFNLVVGRSPSAQEALKAAETIASVASKHIQANIHYLGFIPNDEQMSAAVLSRNLAKVFSSNCFAYQAWSQIAHKVLSRKLGLDFGHNNLRRDPDEGTSQAV